MRKTNPLTHNKKKRARAFFASNKLSEAESLYLQIASKDRRDWEARQMLGTIAWRSRNPDEAEGHFREALAIKAGLHEVHYQLACVLLEKGNIPDTLSHLRTAIRIRPDFFEPYLLLGNIAAGESRLQDAIEAYSQAVNINPQDPVAYSNLGNVLADQGRIGEAMDCWKKALSLQPDYASAHSNLLLCMNYSESLSADEVFQAHLDWAEKYEHNARKYTTHPNIPVPDRNLRIGYVTADMREHSVAYFLEPILENHDSSGFTVYCYSDVARPDAVTGRLYRIAGNIRTTAGLSDVDLAGLIRTDEIDILIDLAGHTSGNRLRMFAQKPAPVQVTYLGYPNTTGLSTMDYRITDSWADPPGFSDHLYTEKLVRLPRSFICYKPPEDSPPVVPRPDTGSGPITFGGFNYVGKMSMGVIRTWSKILHNVTGSKLLLKNKSLTDKSTRERMIELFADHGIPADRLELLGLTTSKAEHLSVYSRVDIALDTFPYNGTTTTCDTLWMGVPVITLSGKTHAGRVGASLLSGLGLNEFIAETVEEYILLASNLANNPEYLMGMRKNLIDIVSNSDLCNGVKFTKDLEAAYRGMWNTWCIEK